MLHSFFFSVHFNAALHKYSKVVSLLEKTIFFLSYWINTACLLLLLNISTLFWKIWKKGKKMLTIVTVDWKCFVQYTEYWIIIMTISTLWLKCLRFRISFWLLKCVYVFWFIFIWFLTSFYMQHNFKLMFVLLWNIQFNF